MALNRGLASPWWALRMGSGIGVRLRNADIEERQESSKDWHARVIRVGSPRHRYLPGHGTRTTETRSRHHRFRAA